MTSTQHSVDIAPDRTVLPYAALVAGIVSLPGSLLTWDTSLPGEGFVWGLPVALLAVVLGIVAIRSRTHSRWAAVTGLVLGGAMAAMVVVWTLVSAG